MISKLWQWHMVFPVEVGDFDLSDWDVDGVRCRCYKVFHVKQV